MKDLIKYESKKGENPVSAVELHSYLSPKSPYGTWFKMLIRDFGFSQGVDFEYIRDLDGEIEDAAISMNMAKEISMVQRTEKGKQTRMYFIEHEKKTRNNNQSLPETQSQLILMMAQQQVDQERKQVELEKRITIIENKPDINAELQHFTVLGYCAKEGLQISLTQAQEYGKALTRICRANGWMTGKMPDPRYGSVKTYPVDALKQVIK